MALHPCQVAAPFQVLNPRDGIAWFYAPFDGTIKRAVCGVRPANVNNNGDAIFDVTIEGVTLFPVVANRPKILSGQKKGYVAGLNVAVAEGDFIEFHAKQIPLGGLQGPIMLELLVDDGVVSGVEVAEADTAPDIAAVTKLVVGNGDLTNVGGGVARILTAGDAYAAVMAFLLTGGLLKASLLPALAINDVFSAANQAAMLALSAQRGDIAVLADTGRTYILSTDDPTTFANWVLIPWPAALALAGDVTGTTAAAVVAALRGITVKDFAAGATLNDSFTDGFFDTTMWYRDDATNVKEQNGRIEITGAAAHNLSLLGAKDMTNKYVQANYGGAGGTWRTWVRVVCNNGEYIEVRIDFGTNSLKVGKHTTAAGDVWTIDRAFNGASDLWWRIKHQSSDNTFHVYNSVDGANWNDTIPGGLTPPSGSAVTACTVYMGFGIAGTSYVDSFNSTIPQTATNLAEGDALFYRASTNQFENYPVVVAVTNLTAASPAPSNVPPGRTVLGVDFVNHRLGFWNPNTVTWDWKLFNNS